MDVASDARSTWAFQPSPKVSRLVPRVVSAAVTEARLRAILPAVPVARVADLSPLDPLGLPVFSAVTPLALDLTTHLGKGADPTSARVSALMEAVERVSAERLPGAIRQASLDELLASSAPAVDPRWFELPDDSAFSPSAPFSWATGWDLLEASAALIPRDLVINPPSEGVLRDVDTNGLASGNTLLEATLHALCEVIERDAVGQLLFVSLFSESSDSGPRRSPIDPRTLPASLLPWLDRIAAEGLGIVVADITTEIGIATLKATLIDEAFPGPHGPEVRIFHGYGADPCAEIAARRAVTEAVQSRTGLIQAARDSWNRIPLGSHAAAWKNSLRELEPGEQIPFSAVPNHEAEDLRDDLDHVLGRLRRAGCTHAIAVDLTRSDLAIPVVRVRVPGLATFWGNRRRVGWRCLRHLL